jgi:hypothetical protein
MMSMLIGKTKQAFALAAVLAVSLPTPADASPEGDWMLKLDGDGPPIIGMLTLQGSADAWTGHVEGGPVTVTIEGDAIEFLIDSRDLAGFVFIRRLTGTLSDQSMSGLFTIEGATEDPEPGGQWSASRKAAERPRQPPQPVDIGGIWTPAPGVDFRKYKMDLTEKAQDWFDGYMMHYDQPNVRCVSPGIVAMVAWGAYPMEVIVGENRLTYLYEVGSEVRRIYLDGKTPPDYYPPSPMGFSNGYWDGRDLIIETQLLEANVRDFRGEPVSEGARMHERYSVSDDGNTLSAVITLQDPDNYKVPPVRRRKWVRNPDMEIYPYECDPDSFYRQMYEQKKLEMYFDRAKRRQLN